MGVILAERLWLDRGSKWLKQALSQRRGDKRAQRNEGNKGGCEVISSRWAQPSGFAPSPLTVQNAAGSVGKKENKHADVLGTERSEAGARSW